MELILTIEDNYNMPSTFDVHANWVLFIKPLPETEQIKKQEGRHKKWITMPRDLPNAPDETPSHAPRARQFPH